VKDSEALAVGSVVSFFSAVIFAVLSQAQGASYFVLDVIVASAFAGMGFAWLCTVPILHHREKVGKT